jgi:putative transcriptional regulator
MIYGKSQRKDLTQEEKNALRKVGTRSEILVALDKMKFSDPALVSVAQGLADALSGRKKVTLRTFQVTAQPEIQPKDIAAIRNKLNVSQAVFAAYLGVISASVMSWEYGTRQPSGAAKKLLSIARKNPKVLVGA